MTLSNCNKFPRTDPHTEDLVEPRVSTSSVRTEDWEDILSRAGLTERKSADADVPRWCLILVGAMSLFHSILLGFDTDVNRDDARYTVKVVFFLLESCFCIAWIVEMCLRMHYMRWSYFVNGWTLLDLCLVSLNIVTAWLVPFFTDSRFDVSSEEGGWVRHVRFLRISRLLRLLKLARMLPELWNIIQGCIQTLRTLAWVLTMLFAVIYTASIFMTVLVGYECNSTWSDWELCEDFFGSVSKSMYTMFQVMTFESWSMAIVRPVIYERWWVLGFFLCFMMLTSFGLLNILVGVVVESTLDVSRQRREVKERDEQCKLLQELKALKVIFEEADQDGNGCMDLSEFTAMIDLPEVKQKCKKLHLPVENPSRLFETIDEDQSGEVTIREFIEGALRMRNTPCTIEMRLALQQIDYLVQMIGAMETVANVMYERLCGGIARSQSPVMNGEANLIFATCHGNEFCGDSLAGDVRRNQHHDQQKNQHADHVRLSTTQSSSGSAVLLDQLQSKPADTTTVKDFAQEADMEDLLEWRSAEETYQTPLAWDVLNRQPVTHPRISSSGASWQSVQQARKVTTQLRKLESSVSVCLGRLKNMQQGVSSLAMCVTANAVNRLPDIFANKVFDAPWASLGSSEQDTYTVRQAHASGEYVASMDVLCRTVTLQKQILGHSQDLLRSLCQPPVGGNPDQEFYVAQLPASLINTPQCTGHVSAGLANGCCFQARGDAAGTSKHVGTSILCGA